APGRYSAIARTEHGFGRTDGSVLVGLGQHVDGVVVKLARAAHVEGKLIIAATKQSCPDGDVRLYDASHRIAAALRETAGGTRAGAGRLPGAYPVEAQRRDSLPHESSPPVAITDKDVTGLVWEVDAGATVRGKVITRSGEPIDGARVNSRPVRERSGDWRVA